MQKGLVTILTPCYNTGSIMHRLFDSILEQDYPDVEMYAINDGSKDNTEEIVKSYISRFEKKGYKLTYIFQENGGQSAAINNGLKYVNGEFLIWPDSDDYFRTSHSISKFVETLSQKGAEYGVVRCIPTYIDEDTSNERVCHKLNFELTKESQFENCLYSRNFFWGAGDYMVRMEAFDKTNPSRKIYVEKDAGQNWQMLLPTLYNYKCITLEESVFNVLERTASHSRGQYKTYKQQLAKFASYKNTILNTLDSIATMPIYVKETYKKNISVKYKLQELELALSFGEKAEVQRLNRELKEYGVPIPTRMILEAKMNQTYIGRGIIKNLKKLLAFVFK